jgi:hypothetical protein
LQKKFVTLSIQVKLASKPQTAQLEKQQPEKQKPKPGKAI